MSGCRCSKDVACVVFPSVLLTHAGPYLTAVVAIVAIVLLVAIIPAIRSNKTCKETPALEVLRILLRR